MPYLHVKTADERLAVCHACPNYKSETNKCAVDNRSVNLKLYTTGCPENRWPIEEYRDEVEDEKPEVLEEPTILKKIQTLAIAIYRWIRSGFLKASKNQFKMRLNICRKCEFWDSKAFSGTGKCKKCGCSTWAKLRMRTEKCPIGKW